MPVFFLYYLETLGIKNKATFPDVQPKKDINLGVDYTGMHFRHNRCAEMQGQGLCPLADSGSQGKKLSVVQEFSGGNGMINDNRTGRK